MNKDILIEKIEYLSSMPHSALVEHCIYLENENDNYKAQKYITDFISENSIICEKNKEIKRLNNIINGIETYCNIAIGMNFNMNNNELQNQIVEDYTKMLDKLKELKGE